jgi:hypothetical protein
VFLPIDVPNRYQNVGDAPGRFLYITSPGGFEKLVEQTSLLSIGATPDMQKIKEMGLKYGVEFI